jgi:hypothetical protein
VPRYVAHYTPEQRRVLELKPGITDLATLEFREEEEMLRKAESRKLKAEIQNGEVEGKAESRKLKAEMEEKAESGKLKTEIDQNGDGNGNGGKAEIDQTGNRISTFNFQLSALPPGSEISTFNFQLSTFPQDFQLSTFPVGSDISAFNFQLSAFSSTELFYLQYCVPRKIQLNLEYAARANLWRDVGIILRTVLNR